MDDLQKRLEKLSPEKRALVIKQLQRKKLAEGAAMPKISQREDTKTHPLSYAQQRMWFLSQWEPENPFYNITAAVRISGLLDQTVFSRSINEIIRRHEVLRASFVIGENGYPIQEVADQVEVSTRELDLTSFMGKKQDQELQCLMVEEATKPFDLTVRPLIRVNLIRLNANEHIVLLTVHHIIADGWSVDIFIHEVATLYEAYSQGKRSPFAELSIQYADFAEWQRDWLQKDVLENQLDYWKQVYQSIPDPLELPTDRPRPVVQTFNGAVEALYIDVDIIDAIKELGQNRNTTLFMTLLAAFFMLLYRYSGQDDICIGSPVSNRNRTEIEGLIGLFVNTLALRADLSGELTFLELLDQVRDITLGAYDHQNLPFEILFDELDIERDLSRTPLFQVMFALQEAPLENLRLRTIELNQVDVDTGTSKFDLTIFLEENPRGLKAMMEYNTDLFDAETITRMLDHFRVILHGIVRNPQQEISLLPILTNDEFNLIVNEWNDTTTDYPRDKNLGQLFEIQVSKTPEKIAITFGDERLTYHELNQRANQLARYLKSLGVGPETLVGIYMERSIEMVVATLGIVKALGVYLPLDLSYPHERLVFILDDAQASIILTVARLENDLPDFNNINPDIKVICLDKAVDQISSESSGNNSDSASMDNLVYVIYTSGTTGIPKGVSITQRAIIRLLFNTSYIKITRNDKVVHASNPSFDASTFEIWGALLFGAELVCVSREITLSSATYVEFLRTQEISVMFITTALFNHVVKEVPDAFISVKNLLFGGEMVDVESVRVALNEGSPERLLHVYGPTESTTFTTWYAVKDINDTARSVPIGSPISNTQVFVLDKYFLPVPVGVVGQLFIGGDGLARGYLDRPQLTAEKFIPNPFIDSDVIESDLEKTQSRLYKTGDLVRCLTDGSIEFIGRVDFQVKLRGLRIELGEIETVINNHPIVHENVTLLREDVPGDKRLVSYLVLKKDQTVNVEGLRGYLKDKLPDFMVPASFVILNSLPINPNGKVDRRALPAPDRKRPDLEKAYIPPTSPIEMYITQKWQEVLGLDRIGIYDNFFELGGDSLKAAVLINRLQEDFGEKAHVKALFLAPTIAELAIYMSEYYPQAVAKLLHKDSTREPTLEESNVTISEKGLAFEEELTADEQRHITAEKINTIRQIIRPIDQQIQHIEDDKTKNPPAVFILSPPRSGSTLFRTMLAGSPQLFAPPELDLLSFNTLTERKEVFQGENSFWLEGVIRAIVEIKEITADQAKLMMKDYEEDGMTSKEFYYLLQTWIKDKVLVDKTPVYALDLEILKQAEDYFDNPLYIHLTRHPYASIYSFVEAKLDEVFFRYENPFSKRELAELVWIISHQNIQHFLDDIPHHRQMRISFEDLVTNPENVMREASRFLGIEYCPDMISPYDGDRMTSSVTPNGQMVGDFKFYLRKKIDDRAADRWKKFHAEDFLSDVGIELAEQLGYQIEHTEVDQAGRILEKIELIDRDKDLPLPLSYAQQRLWFLDQWDPGSPYYNIPSAVRLRGPLDIHAFEESINKVVKRHEVLRTAILSVNGKPLLSIEDIEDITLPVTDLSKIPKELRENEAGRFAEREVRKPFDLSVVPLIRSHLIKMGSEDHILILTLHHIAADGWSMGILIREIAAFYQSFTTGKDPEIRDLPIQYVDYAAWQKEWLEGAVLAKQMDYWKEKLENSPTLLELPTDKPRPPVQSLRGKQYYFELSESLSQGIKQLSNMEEKTLFMTLLAAFQVLLYRYSHETDMNIGTPIANRNREEIESLVGFFVNTLVLRGDLSGNPTFTELLDRVYKTTVEAYDNQDVPFEHLVDELNLERAMSHTPLFQVMFTLQEAPARTIDLTGLSIEPIELDSGTAKYDLIFTIVDRGDILRGVVEYNLDLFKGATIERFVNHFNVLLEGIIENVEIPISNLPILTLTECDFLLNRWGRGNKPERLVQFEPLGELVDEPRRQTLHRLFERQVKLSGQSRAVVEVDPNLGENSLTYDELNKMANQLAHYLIKSGVGQNELVGLLVERSIYLFIGILGIWKAGAAYLPLDPSYPPDRLNFMLEDAHVRILLSQMALQEHPLIKQIHGFAGETQSDGIRTIYLDEDWGMNFGAESENILEIDAGSESLAYVIYTSGSTGKPKGVMIEHYSAINLWMGLSDAIYAHHPGEGLRVSLNAPLPFDASVQQLVMLLSGHTLFVIPQEVRMDGSSLLDFIQEKKLDVLDCVPSQLKLLLDAGLLENGDWIPRVILPGGEEIDEQIWSRLADQDEIDFFNMYGPTECTVDSTICRIIDYPDQPSIGLPIIDGRVYVLDSYLRPVPVGVPGELYIGGAGVGRGYLRRPALSAEKFVPDPYSDNPEGARLYRTGDLVRYRPDGYLEFLGRIDYQVKVRGFRIELGEIESALLDYPSMKDVAVIAREDKPGEKQLVAYYVRETEPQESVESLTIGELRGFLKEKLPDYMIPSIYVALDFMPLTPNAKINRNALPKPEGIRPELDATLVAPSTEVEDKLVDIWVDVLGLDALGIHDNFFELGGDSILSIQIISKARQENIHLTPRDMFEAQTIHKLAQISGREKFIHAEQGIVTGSVPLTPIQHHFFSQELKNPHHWNQALMLDIRSEEDSDAKKREEAVRSQLEQALQHILIHHDVLRMRFEIENSNWTQSNADVDEYIPFEWVDMSAYEKGERNTRMEEISADYQSTLNVSGGPLIRVVYFDFGPGAYSRLLFIIHHLAVDGVSWRIILEDFQTIFLQLNNNMQVSLPQKTTSYRYWAQSLSDYSRTEEVKHDLDYWVGTTKLSNPPLPLDHSNGENLEESAQNIRIVLDREDTLTLLQEVPKAYNTEITDVLLTALVMTFNKWTGASSLFVNLEGHGREDITNRNSEDIHDKMGIDISRTVGWFTSLFPVRLSAGGIGGIGDAIVSIKEQLRKIPKSGVTYGILQYLSPWADELLCDLDGNKLFIQPELSFNFLGKVDEGMINPLSADTDLSQNLFLGLSENNLGPVHGPINKREHLIDIISSVTNGQLRIEWIYSENYHKRETIQELADSYVRFLLEITTNCLSRESVVYTPSDFEDVDMDQEDLDAILDELGEV